MESAAKSENECSNDVVTSNFDSSDAEFASTTEGSLTEEKMRNCKYCHYQAPDWPMFAIHVLKPSHVKKVAEAMKVRVAVHPVLTSITCEVCNVTCCGYIPWNAHLMGAKHRKAKEEQEEKVKKKNNAGGPIRNTGNVHNKKPYDGRPNKLQQAKNSHTPQKDEFATYPQPLIGLDYVTQTDRTGKIQWYHCSICDVKFDGNLKFPHLVGQKHRLNVLKVKRPGVVEGLNSNGKKRSELTPILQREAQKLEDEEGRQQIKSNFPKHNPNFNPGPGTKGGRGSNRDARGTMRGGRGNRGTSSTRERGNIVGQNSTLGQQERYSTYDDNFENSHSSGLSYNSAYNASLNNAEYGGNYQTRYDSNQFQYGSGPSYSTTGRSYADYSHFDNVQSYSSQNTPSRGSVAQMSTNSNLEAALNDLTKLIQTEEDASVAFSVSNALTKSLIKFRTTGLQ